MFVKFLKETITIIIMGLFVEQFYVQFLNHTLVVCVCVCVCMCHEDRCDSSQATVR